MLRVTLLGNLGADPEVRYTSKGSTMATLRVAVNQVRQGPDGERQENTEWFRVKAMGRLAEFAQRLSKGSKVLVVGRLEIGKYQSREGETRTSFDVWADEVQSMASGSFRPTDAEGFMDADAGAPEPAMAGAASSAAPARTNGKPPRRPEGPSTPPAADLEDLPV